jgi:hypothetical protein
MTRMSVAHSNFSHMVMERCLPGGAFRAQGGFSHAFTIILVGAPPRLLRQPPRETGYRQPADQSAWPHGDAGRRHAELVQPQPQQIGIASGRPANSPHSPHPFARAVRGAHHTASIWRSTAGCSGSFSAATRCVGAIRGKGVLRQVVGADAEEIHQRRHVVGHRARRPALSIMMPVGRSAWGVPAAGRQFAGGLRPSTPAPATSL